MSNNPYREPNDEELHISALLSHLESALEMLRDSQQFKRVKEIVEALIDCELVDFEEQVKWPVQSLLAELECDE